MNTTRDLSTKLKMLREVHDYTQDYVAGVLEISQNTYSLLEKGETKITIDRLIQLARLYKMELVDLLKTNDQTYVNNVSNSSINSDNININNNIKEEEREIYKKTIDRLETEVTKLLNLIEKLTAKLQ